MDEEEIVKGAQALSLALWLVALLVALGLGAIAFHVWRRGAGA